MLVPSSSQKQFLEQASTAYAESLKGAQSAVDYLKSRSFSGVSAQSFRLGFVEEPLTGHESYRGRLCIPYLTRGGVVSLRFRRIGDGEGPKYLGLPGDTLRVFNPDALHKPGPDIAICEGELDTITAVQAGLSAVGIPGVQALKPYTPRMFKGYDRVFILADNDDKGQGSEFANDLAGLIENARVVLMPDGHDVNSFVTESGPDALRAMLGKG